MPEIKTADGTYRYCDDKLHADNGGPAIQLNCGSKLYYMHGKPHRTDGPAIECGNGLDMWFLDGVRLSKEEHTLRTKT